MLLASEEDSSWVRNLPSCSVVFKLRFGRNIVSNNIMMDPDGMYPDGFHPVRIELSPDLRQIAWHYPRVVPHINVKYYFTGFGSASWTSEDENGPEAASTKGDISDLGQVFFKEFCEVRYRPSCTSSALTIVRRSTRISTS